MLFGLRDHLTGQMVEMELTAQCTVFLSDEQVGFLDRYETGKSERWAGFAHCRFFVLDVSDLLGPSSSMLTLEADAGRGVKNLIDYMRRVHAWGVAYLVIEDAEYDLFCEGEAELAAERNAQYALEGTDDRYMPRVYPDRRPKASINDTPPF